MTSTAFDAVAHPRTPAGVSAGGQFSAKARSEAAVNLSAPAPITTGDHLTYVVPEGATRLAAATAERTGWPVVAVASSTDPATRAHVGVRTPSGQILDISGLSNEATWADRWSHRLEPSTRDHVRAVVVDAPEVATAAAGSADQRAEQVAGLLLAELGDVARADVPPLSEADEDTFTGGYCHRLGQALQDRTGWPQVVVADGPRGSVGWVHVGVRTPSGQILDVRGLHTEDDWVEEWGPTVDAYGHDLPEDAGYDGDDVWVYPADQLGWNDDTGWGAPEGGHREATEKRAREVAEMLIEKYRAEAEK